jgi:hypothetical protein
MFKFLLTFDCYLAELYPIDPWWIRLYSFLVEPVYGWYRLKTRLLRVWNYLPVIWNLYDFDWTSATIIYVTQLKRVLKVMETSEVHAHPRSRIRKLKRYILAFDHITNDYNDHRVIEEFYRKWGKPVHKTIRLPPDDKGRIRISFYDQTYENLTEKQKARYDKEFKECIKEGQKRDQELWDYIQQFNKKHLKSCWD